MGSDWKCACGCKAGVDFSARHCQLQRTVCITWQWWTTMCPTVARRHLLCDHLIPRTIWRWHVPRNLIVSGHEIHGTFSTHVFQWGITVYRWFVHEFPFALYKKNVYQKTLDNWMVGKRKVYPCACQEAILGSEGIAPLIPNLGTRYGEREESVVNQHN